MPKRPANFQKSTKRTATVNDSSSSEEDIITLEEPASESNTSMAKRLRGTVTPSTSTSPIAGPRRQFAAGIHQKTAHYLFELTKISLKKSINHVSCFQKASKLFKDETKHLPLIYPIVELTVYIFEIIFTNPIIKKESYLNFFNAVLSRWITMLKQGALMPTKKAFRQSVQLDCSHHLVKQHHRIEPFLLPLANNIAKRLSD